MFDCAMHFGVLRSVRIFQSGDLPELATVVDGTKCGNEMVSVMYKVSGNEPETCRKVCGTSVVMEARLIEGRRNAASHSLLDPLNLLHIIVI